MSFCTVPYSPKWSRVAPKDLAADFSPEWGSVGVPGRRSSIFGESIVGDRSIHNSESNRFEVPCSARRLSSLVSSSLVSSVSLRNAENRLTKIEDGSILKATYQYDFMGRRVRKQVGSVVTWYVYDGFNELGRFTQTGTGAPAIQRTFTWGLDISNSPQGAGGVGGLLAVKVHGTTSATYFPTYDANGNISEYLASNGSVAAHFEYDGFGNTVVNTDTNGLFDYRFSTKPLEDVTGFYYYGYRYYDPVTGRWPSRDMLGEKGGMNLYGFVGNDSVNRWDLLGMLSVSPKDMIDVGSQGNLSWSLPPTISEEGKRDPNDSSLNGGECNEKEITITTQRYYANGGFDVQLFEFAFEFTLVYNGCDIVGATISIDGGSSSTASLVDLNLNGIAEDRADGPAGNCGCCKSVAIHSIVVTPTYDAPFISSRTFPNIRLSFDGSGNITEEGGEGLGKDFSNATSSTGKPTMTNIIDIPTAPVP